MIIAIICSLMWVYMTFNGMSKLEIKRIKKEQLISLSGIYILERLKLEQLSATIIQHLHVNLMLIEKIGWSFQHTKQRMATKLGEAFIVLLGGAWLAYLSSEQTLYLVTSLCIMAILFQLYQGSIQKVKERKQAIVIELPIILTKMTLLIEAGETLSQAFVHCMEDEKESNHSLHTEWNLAIAMLQNGESFPIVIEKFTKRCSVQAVSVMATYMLLNYARGGSYFVTSIQDLMNELWEQRKTIARKKGEEASSKLIFPTIVILLLLMVLIVTPAIRLIDVI